MTRLVFSADDGSTGRELWTTDGTAAGTQLLADLWPGGGPGNPTYITALGDGRAVFSGTDPLYGTEPWITDGTAAGTHQILDLNAGSSGFGSSSPGNFTLLQPGRALFTASDLAHGTEPWITDGTAAGTRVLEILPGAAVGSYVNGPFVPAGGGRAFFAASEPVHGTELWVTDGTQDGTRLVADIAPGSNGSYPGGYPGAPAMAALGDGRVVFVADDGANGRELWVSDGTASGTFMVADLWPGTTYPFPSSSGYPGSSSPGNFAALAAGRVLFTATDAEHGTELWVTDGTRGGTHLVVDLAPGTYVPYPGASPTGAGSSPSNILVLGDGRALLATDDGTHGRELWITDGTEAGTRLVKDIWEGGGSGNPGSVSYSYSPSPPYGPPPYPGGSGGSLALGDGRALFSATDPVHGTELWITDGTEAGTRLVEDINRNTQGFAGSNPSGLAALDDGRAVFVADDGANGSEPWITDGTAEGTQLLRNLNPGAGSSGAGGFATVSGGGGAPAAPPSPPQAAETTDWNALAAQALEHYQQTGEWFV